MTNRYELGNKTWPILVKAAREHGTCYYGDVAKQLGYRGARVVGTALWPIQDLCIEKGWPPLTSLVVNQRTDKPGPGFVAWPGDLEAAHEAVFAFPWQDLPTPFQPESIDRLERVQQQAQGGQQTEGYAVPDSEVHVNGRGPYQNAFRRILIAAYSQRCALCDSRLDAVLVASHIVPWALDRNNRMNPRNGILLCRNHDALFESGYIRIATDHSVTTSDASAAEFGRDLYNFVTDKTSSRLRRPTRGYEPGEEFLQWRLTRYAS